MEYRCVSHSALHRYKRQSEPGETASIDLNYILYLVNSLSYTRLDCTSIHSLRMADGENFNFRDFRLKAIFLNARISFFPFFLILSILRRREEEEIVLNDIVFYSKWGCF